MSSSATRMRPLGTNAPNGPVQRFFTVKVTERSAVTARVGSVSRRTFCGAVAAAIVAGTRVAAAGEAMPASIEAELVARLASYDRNLKARAGARVTILIAVKEGDAISERDAAQLVAAFARIEHVGGLPHETSIEKFSGSTNLVAACKAKRAAIVLVTEALASEVEALRAAFEGVDVLTVGPSADMARRGMVLGVELVSSRPKLFTNLTQAGKQNVAMSAEVLKLMTVYR